MCRLGPKLKLCTCALGRLRRGRLQLRSHVWILFRLVPGKENFVIGRVVTPDELDAETEAANRALLLARLQEPDVFDTDLGLRPGDRLLLSFRLAAPTGDARKHLLINYGYEFNGVAWEECPYDPLSWDWRHDRELAGLVRDVLA